MVEVQHSTDKHNTPLNLNTCTGHNKDERAPNRYELRFSTEEEVEGDGGGAGGLVPLDERKPLTPLTWAW